MNKELSNFIEDIKKNGFPWNRDGHWTDGNGAYCVLGQGLAHYADPDLDPCNEELYESHLGYHFGVPEEVVAEITVYNDREAASLEDAINFAVNRLTPYVGSTSK